MKKPMMMRGVLCLLFLTSASFAAAEQQAQPDSAKSDSMRRDDMSHNGMAKDQMSHEMGKVEVLKGWVSDSECAAHGEKKCGDKKHLAQGAKLVIVTDGDNAIWTVSNPEKLAEHQGHYVQIKATKDSEKRTVNVQEVKMLKQGK
jgi:pentapeptide MXKDX repeat protein